MRKLITLLVVLLATQVGRAQVYMKPHFGVKIGMTSGYTAYSPKDTITTFRYKTDLHIGVFYRMRNEKWVFQPELQFMVKGGTWKRPREIIFNNYNYVTFMPVVGYIPTEGLTFEVAPEFSYATNTPSTYGPPTRKDFGVMLGARYDFLDMLEDFSLNVRYMYGFTNISDKAGLTMNNRAFSVSLIYNWYKKK
ncbi:MAG: outer membrane beta-barrel protein [Spirosomataceae bacterium]